MRSYKRSNFIIFIQLTLFSGKEIGWLCMGWFAIICNIYQLSGCHILIIKNCIVVHKLLNTLAAIHPSLWCMSMQRSQKLQHLKGWPCVNVTIDVLYIYFYVKYECSGSCITRLGILFQNSTYYVEAMLSSGLNLNWYQKPNLTLGWCKTRYLKIGG